MNWIERALSVAKRKGLTQRDLARAAGVEHPRVTQWKKGEGKPYLDQAANIAAALDVSLDWLANGDAGQARTRGNGEPLDLDSELILRCIEAIGLSPQEALRRLTAGPPVIVPDRPSGR